MLMCFAIQHGGILRSSERDHDHGYRGAAAPDVDRNRSAADRRSAARQLLCRSCRSVHDAAGNPIDGSWDKAGWILFIGGLFIAAWSTYGFETAVCYTREFKDPKRDTFRAIFYSGLVCLAVFILVPLSFQGALGLAGMLAPDIY